ncbi:MAG: hypothetical protein HY253_11810 [Burkholderiales bacterium]|nr:hypothetical protein [Burkholderiales bacterium]
MLLSSRDHTQAQKTAAMLVEARLVQAEELRALEQDNVAKAQLALQLLEQKRIAEEFLAQETAKRVAADQAYLQECEQRILAEQEARIAVQNRLAAESEVRVLAAQRAQLEQDLNVTEQNNANDLMNLQQAQTARLELEATLADKLQEQLAMEHELSQLHQASLRDIELKIEAENLILQESRARADAEHRCLTQAQERLAQERLAAANEAQRYDAEVALTLAQAALAQEEEKHAGELLKTSEQQTLLSQLEAERAEAEKQVAHLLAEQVLEAQHLHQLAQQRLQREREAQELMQQRVAQEQAAVELADAKHAEELAILAQTEALQMQLKKSAQAQIENSLAKQQQIQQQCEQEKQHALGLTQQLIDRLTLDRAQHATWCHRANEILQASPSPHQFDFSVLEQQAKMAEAAALAQSELSAKRKSWRSPVLFSVLMSLGLLSVASWSVMQAQADASPQAKVNTIPSQAPLAAETKVSAVPVSSAESLRMTYQLQPETPPSKAL